MKESSIEIKDYKIYYRETVRGWAVAIMPNKIRIDNFHGFPHIHYSLKGKHQPIKTGTLTEALKIVLNYLSENDELVVEDLKNELG
jgi:hypothetical protein